MFAHMSRLHTIFIGLTAFLTLSSCSTTQSVNKVSERVAQPPISALPPPVAPVPAIAPVVSRLQTLQRQAPELDAGVLALALEAQQCAARSGEVAADTRLAIIDYSLPSTKKRLWVFDLANDRLLYNELVAHGQGSGDNYATRFSNTENSHQTSLGLFRTAETYTGGNGYSLRMDGLDPGFNDNARARAIVMHGAWYVDSGVIAKQGRIGRSHGCPALRQGIAHEVINTLRQRQLVFAYANDAAWLRGAKSFSCGGKSAQQIVADARRDMHQGGGAVIASALSAP